MGRANNSLSQRASKKNEAKKYPKWVWFLLAVEVIVFPILWFLAYKKQ